MKLSRSEGRVVEELQRKKIVQNIRYLTENCIDFGTSKMFLIFSFISLATDFVKSYSNVNCFFPKITNKANENLV